ncbi:HEPN domain-containing protein [Desulfobacula sp.]|uniref:HEPN domain-containing protein n=1 Tax=Desulfobacula sp. TaxID=2593537 RepID=UPI0039B95D37
MAKKDTIHYWVKTADQDWKVANHLFEKGDYSYALFFGHLTIEKIVKAIFTDKNEQTPPFSHNLVYLCEKAGIELDDQKLELLEEISDFNLEARYPDDKFSFYKKCTIGFTKNKLKQIRVLREWFLQKL